jgi:hypothetical protein
MAKKKIYFIMSQHVWKPELPKKSLVDISHLKLKKSVQQFSHWFFGQANRHKLTQDFPF